MAAVPINVEIISKEMIRPSSPTPNHLRNVKLSLIDKLASSSCIPLIFFYQMHDENMNRVEICRRLKQSLSYVLTFFYPLAGRVRENSYIDCNDEGAEFIGARVTNSASLLQVIEDPKMEELENLLPVLQPFKQIMKDVLLSVKINFFDSCGGIAVGICMSHKIGDAISLALFLNAWAAAAVTSSRESIIYQPNFGLADIFPPTGSNVENPMGRMPNADKIITKRLVFDNEKIEKLKQIIVNEAACNSSAVKNPTRVEAISTFLWQRFIHVAKAKETTTKVFGTLQIVNLRPRTNPPLSPLYFGNCSRNTLAVHQLVSEHDDEYNIHQNNNNNNNSSSAAAVCCAELVEKLRVAVRKIDDEYIKKVLQNEEHHVNDHLTKVIELYQGGAHMCGFSSFVKFPMYDVDFGWGKPVWVSSAAYPFNNSVILMPTPCGNGIEALISIAEDDSQLFDLTDYKFNLDPKYE